MTLDFWSFPLKHCILCHVWSISNKKPGFYCEKIRIHHNFCVDIFRKVILKQFSFCWTTAQQ